MEKNKYERKFVVSEPSHKLYKSGIVEFIFGEDMKLNFVNFIFDGQKFTAPMNSRDYAKKIGAWILTNAQTGAPINYEEKVRLYFFCKDAVKKYKEDVSISFIRILEDFPSQIELIEKYLEDEKGLNAFEKKQRIEKVCHKNRDINSLNSYFRSIINSKKQKRVFLERAVEDEKSKLEILREKKGLGKPTKLADFLTTSFEITKSNFENIKYGVLKTEFKENNKNIKRI